MEKTNLQFKTYNLHFPIPAKQAKGFTLLEVMVAITILGIGFVVIFQLFSIGLNSVERSEKYTIASIYAKEKLNEMLAMPEPQEGIQEGSSGKDNEFSWKAAALRYDTSSFAKEPPFNIYQLTADVTWQEGLKQKNVHLETLKTVAKK
ncbi:MAG: prepilin-type N-terminal cleavage/methylation domain-containing protein [Deltaproteobacteria bacterium]|nr:prepilin-type N-terminal cleavage/methylation domain-containing protein [Deltaproteobacteria bacterium]